MVAAAGFVRETSVRRRSGPPTRERLRGTDVTLSRWLRPIQLALSLFFAAVLIGLGILAL
jgi:hypothetical protein